MTSLFADYEPPTTGQHVGLPPSVVGRLARASDPVASEQAAVEHEQSGKLRANQRLCLALVREYPGCTACELHEAQGDRGTMMRHEVSRRLPEVEKLGLIRKGPARECGVAGTKQSTWIPVDLID